MSKLKLFSAMMMMINFQVFAVDFNTFHSFDSAVENDCILDLHREKRFTKSCTQSEGLLLSADYVKLSDFVGFNGRFPNECGAKMIKLLAKRELIIDRDLIASGNELRVMIMAPRWTVSGFRSMHLDVETFLGVSNAIINEENLIMAASGSKFNKLIKLGNETEIPFDDLLTKFNPSTNNFDADLIDKKWLEIKPLRRVKRDVSSNDAVPRHIWFAINTFKTLLREKSANDFEHKKIMKMYEVLENNEEIQNFRSALSLVKDFDRLENQYFSLKKNPKIDFFSFYKSLLNQISEYAKIPKSNENSREYKKIYNYLYTAALSKMNVLKNNTEPNLIVDIPVFMKSVNDKFKDLSKFKTEFKKVQSINKQNEEYKAKFENKITEAMDFIHKEIMPGIDEVNEGMSKQMQQLVDENAELINNAKLEKEKAIEARDKMAKNVVLGKVFGAFKVVAAFASILGPVGTVAGAVIGLGTTVAEHCIIDDSDTKQFLTKLPPGVNELLDKGNELLKSFSEQKKKDFQNEVDTISKELSAMEPQEVPSAARVTAEVRKELAELDTNDVANVGKLTDLKKQLKKSLEKDQADLRSKSKDKTDKYAKWANKIDMATKLIGASSSIVDLVNKIKDDEKNLELATATIDQANENIIKLQKFEDRIYEELIPLKKKMFGNMTKATQELDGKSLAALDVSKWKVQSALRDIKVELKKIIATYKVEGDILRSIDKLEEVMTTIINVYDRIANYQEQKQLADYLKDITSNPAQETNISDPELNTAVQRLEIVIKSNIVINEYDITINALKQWMFPFAEHYLGDFQLPAHIFNYSSATLEETISMMDEKIKLLNGQISTYKAVVHTEDQYIHNAVFKGNQTSVKPFYVWNNQRFKEEISTILKGNETSLLADVKSSFEDKDAIKFSKLRIYFKVDDESKQMELDKVLDSFKIIANHSGNSYYRFQGKFYALNSKSLSFDYHFENRPNGDPVDFNDVYGKVKNGDVMLSPYTMWKIKIVKVPDTPSSYIDLLRFQDDVSIELQGEGIYVAKYVEDADANEWLKYQQ